MEKLSRQVFDHETKAAIHDAAAGSYGYGAADLEMGANILAIIGRGRGNGDHHCMGLQDRRGGYGVRSVDPPKGWG